MCPALYYYITEKTESACEFVVSAAGFNIYTLTLSPLAYYI
jgi:hypothetical protein